MMHRGAQQKGRERALLVLHLLNKLVCDVCA